MCMKINNNNNKFTNVKAPWGGRRIFKAQWRGGGGGKEFLKVNEMGGKAF